MMNFVSKILKRKVLSGFIIIVVLVAGYFIYKNFSSSSVTTKYITSAAAKGNLTVSVSGTGQVSASSQVDIKPKTSGDVVRVAATNGQTVKKGDILVQLDSSDAQKTIRDAEVSLESAKLSLEKLKQPASELSLIQAENSLVQVQETKQTAIDNLEKIYEDAFNTAANAFLDLPTIITGLQDTLLGSTLGNNGQWNKDYYVDAIKSYDDNILAKKYSDDAYEAYQKARAAYDKSFDDYKSVSRSSDTSVIEVLINETYETTRSIAEAAKSENNLIQFYEDKLTERNLKYNSLADTYISSLNTYIGKTNTHLLNLLSAKSGIQTGKDDITNADRSIAEKTTSLAELKAGADPLDIKAQELSIQQKENALLDAREKLSDYYIRAPFDGVIASVDVKVGDSASSGTAVATIVTKQQMAEITLNEVDLANVKIGQKVTITFDAVTGLTITGTVAEIDSIGTVSQGVVSYGVTIAFDVQDDRIKSGMSMSADIITESKIDVLLVPATAVKTANETSYVQVLVNGTPQQKVITTGLSDDKNIEVMSGLNEGDAVITQTLSSTTTSSTSTNSNSSNDAMRSMMQLNGAGGGPR
jgi:HlyD family secretion protein